MKIVVFSKYDYNFAAKLAKICDTYSDQLVFSNTFNDLVKFKNQKDLLIIVDLNDYSDNLDSVIDSIISIHKFSICALIQKMESKIQKQATRIGFDIVMSKEMFLMNFKTIRQQIINLKG
tara:strand:- start:11660 stop:12019 length:360 start_codon:yes stop_codon:yes gene_type:complete